MSLLDHCSVELVKIAKEDSNKSYLHAMAATAPIAAMQAASDVPEGWAEKGVETRIKKHLDVPMPMESSNFRRGIARGTGRLSAALITTPLFLKGLKDVKEGKTRDQRMKGYAEVVGSGMGFAGLKGAIEAGVENAGTGKGSQEIWKKVRSLAGARTLVGAGSGVITAATASAMLKRQEKDKDNKVERFVVPAITGAAFGAGKGAIEHGVEHGRGSFANPHRVGELKARMGGKVAGGLVAGLLFNEIFRHAFGKEKKAEAEMRFAPQPSDLYQQTRAWADKTPTDEVRRQMGTMGTPEATPARRASYYAMHDTLTARGVRDLPATPLRKDTHPMVKAPTMVDTGLVLAAISAPQAAWHLGFAKLKPDQQDKLLAAEVDRMIGARSIERLEAKKDMWGNPDTFFSMTADGKKAITAAKAGEVMPEALAHELGHASAKGLRLKTIGSQVAHDLHMVTGIPSILISLFAIEGYNDKSFTTPAELEARAGFISNLGVVAGALQAPHLAEEVAASVGAVKILQEAGATRKQALFKGLRTLGPAFLTHATPTAAPFIAAAYLKHKADQGRKRATLPPATPG